MCSLTSRVALRSPIFTSRYDRRRDTECSNKKLLLGLLCRNESQNPVMCVSHTVWSVLSAMTVCDFLVFSIQIKMSPSFSTAPFYVMHWSSAAEDLVWGIFFSYSFSWHSSEAVSRLIHLGTSIL